MIVHTLRNRRFRALSLRMIARGSTVFGIAGLVLAGQMGFASAAPAPATSASSALTMGGLFGILDIFNSRDPLRKVKPDQVYKTKYGNITGAEYEQRVLQERVIAYEAAIRAGGTARADWDTRRRAREVERKIRRDDDVTAVASGMMAAGDWEERAAAETVLKAAAVEKPWWARSSRSSRPAFRKGMGSYRAPTRENQSEVRDNAGTVYLSTAPRTPSPVSAPSQAAPIAGSSSFSGPMPSLATMKPTTSTPAVAAPRAATAASRKPAPAPASSLVETPEVTAITPPKPAPQAKSAAAAEPKADEEAAPESGHADMSSKEKLRMAVFGEASDVVGPEAEVE